MNLVEIKGNILDLAENEIIAHTISLDYTLGAGLAKKLNEKHNLSYELYKNYDDATVGSAVRIKNIFNLIVKEMYKDKVNEEDIYKALENLKLKMETENIKQIHMPRICCGREKMKWEDIKNIIYDVFNETDIIIYVYNLEYKSKTLNNDIFNESSNSVSSITNERKCTLYKDLLAFAVKMIPDEDDIFGTLISLGFTKEEIDCEKKYINYIRKHHKHKCNNDGRCKCNGNCSCHDNTKNNMDEMENYTFETGF